MVKSDFRAVTNDGVVVLQLPIRAKTLEQHDAILDSFIKRAQSLGGRHFFVVAK